MSLFDRHRIRHGADLLHHGHTIVLIPCLDELTVGDAEDLSYRQRDLPVGGGNPEELTGVSPANGPPQQNFIASNDGIDLTVDAEGTASPQLGEAVNV